MNETINKKKRYGVLCLCPMCRCRHYRSMKDYKWVGKGIPRKYCATCRYHAKKIGDKKVYLQKGVYI